MSEELKDILSHLHSEVDQQALLRYLQGKLSAEQQHELEKQMQEDDFSADALDGLQEIKDKKKITDLVAQLNRDLKKKTAKNKKRREKQALHIDPWIIISVI